MLQLIALILCNISTSILFLMPRNNIWDKVAHFGCSMMVVFGWILTFMWEFGTK